MSGQGPRGLPPWLSWFLTTIGAPVAVGAATGATTQNPWVGLATTVLTWMLTSLTRLMGKVGERLDLEKRLADGIANRLEAWGYTFVARYPKQYSQHLIYRHRDFDVKGLSHQGPFNLELERVFVQLRVTP